MTRTRAEHRQAPGRIQPDVTRTSSSAEPPSSPDVAVPPGRGGSAPHIVAWSEDAGDRAVGEALELLRAGALVAHPTETVYGLAADARRREGYDALLSIKGGTAPRPFLLLFDGPRRVERTLGELPPGGPELADAFWPGPLTLLFPAPAGVPAWWTGAEGEVAVRVTSHPFCTSVLRALQGPVLSTSANRSGAPIPRTASEVVAALDPDVPALIVDGGELGVTASTIARWVEGEWTALRSGPISWEAVLEVLARAARHDPERARSPGGEDVRPARNPGGAA